MPPRMQEIKIHSYELGQKKRFNLRMGGPEKGRLFD